MRHLALALVVLSLSACAGRQTQSTTPIQLDTMRVTARQDADGAIVTNAYDAEMLFEQGLREMRNERCEAAVPIFDRVADEFEGSRFVSPALYDAGLCLRRLERFEEAADRFERLIREVPDSDDIDQTGSLTLEAWFKVDAYAGTYGNSYYGPLVVTANHDALSMSLGPAGKPVTFALAPFDGDTFSFETIGENGNGLAGAIFSVVAGALKKKVVLDFYDVNGLGTFVRE